MFAFDQMNSILCAVQNMWSLVRCRTESKYCNASLIISSSAYGSLQMCNCIPVVSYLLFFYSWPGFCYSVMPFSEELSIKSRISDDLNMQYSLWVHGVSTLNSGCVFHCN